MAGHLLEETGDTLVARAKAAFQLAYLAAWIDPQKIEAENITDMISVLKTSDGPVLEGLTVAIGAIGSRAEPAGSTLQNVLSRLDCRSENSISINNIRTTLQKLGVKPMAPPCPT